MLLATEHACQPLLLRLTDMLTEYACQPLLLRLTDMLTEHACQPLLLRLTTAFITGDSQITQVVNIGTDGPVSQY